MSVDISVSITEDVVDIIATPTVNIVNVTNSASIDPGLYDLSEFTNTSPNPFVRASGLSSYVPTSRTITINGLTQDLSINRSWTIPATTWGTITGTLSAQTDLQSALDAKVPTTRTLTINGVTQDLSANRTFTISTGITIGSTAIASGVVGRVLFEGAGNVVQESSSLFWDATNNRLGIGTSTPAFGLDVVGTARVSGILSTPSGLDLAGWYLYASGTSNATLFGGSSWVFDTVAGGGYRFRTAGNTDRLRIESTGNVLIGTTTDAGFRLDVNGTARVQGNTTISLNQNAATELNVSNTNNSASSQTLIRISSSSGSGLLGRYSASTTPYKTLAANDTFFYSAGTSDISLLNDFASGRIKFTAGGASTAQMTLFSTGNFAINTTTDAGFRLDVNGTARVSGLLTVGPNPGNFLQTGGSTAVWFSDASNPLRITLVQALINLNNAGDFTIHRTMSSARGVISTNPETFNLAVEGYSRVDGIFNRNLSNVNKSVFYASTNGGGSVTNAPILRYFHAVKGNVTGYTSYRGVEIEDLDSYFGTTSGSVGIGANTSINASAILDITSTTKGFLPPRMTTTQKNAIASPAAGLMVYDTTLNVISYYNGSMWI